MKSVKKVLVVDDNADAADALAAFLSLSGFVVRCAYAGRDAIDEARAFRPDAVLLDINMPAVSGYDVARALKEHPRAPVPMIVAVTGWAAESDKLVAKLVGFQHFLAKPVNRDALLELLSA